MIKIYHNPRCRKSREGLQILEDSGKEFEIIKYLDEIPTEEELSYIIKLLNINPIDLVRKNESIWKDNFKNKELTDNEIITAMVKNPKLIERPIVVNNNKAIVGRPPENIKKII
ncbi:MAG: arsenate reductase (glutaredoxin) [Flavobacteriaceae bacterium]|nr:arsenate reductase (glutaredoxin) [Flavobacteriaceae bacterium]